MNKYKQINEIHKRQISEKKKLTQNDNDNDNDNGNNWVQLKKKYKVFNVRMTFVDSH